MIYTRKDLELAFSILLPHYDKCVENNINLNPPDLVKEIAWSKYTNSFDAEHTKKFHWWSVEVAEMVVHSAAVDLQNDCWFHYDDSKEHVAFEEIVKQGL